MAKNPYEILGIHENATEEEVRAAYKQLVQQYSAEGTANTLFNQTTEEKIEELNTAFDEIMSLIRTGSASSGEATNERSQNAIYADIRQTINQGSAEAALQKLEYMPTAERTAEWYFLSGSAYYYKGWLNEAVSYFSQAVQLDPYNKEYNAALNRLRGQGSGNMSGNPYGQYNSPQAGTCGPCNLCTTLLCLNCFCGGRGGCC